MIKDMTNFNRNYKTKMVEKTQDYLFFVFTCVKNGRKYIEKLFDSLLEQTLTNFVHFIYDDGSDDPIDDLVDEYRKKVSLLANPFPVIYEKNTTNIGINMATQYCISKCCARYFVWIDCDNWIDKNFFNEMTNTINRKGNKFIVYRSNGIRVDCNNKRITGELEINLTRLE